MRQLIKGEKIVRDEFNNKLFIIASKHNLEIKDLFIDKKSFFQRLAKSIISIDYLDERFKENIVYEIRNNKILIESNDDTLNLNNKFNEIPSSNYSDINGEKDKNTDHIAYNENIYDEDDDDNIKLNKIDNKKIFRLTSIVTGIIFISSFIFTSFIRLISKAFGSNAIILVNTIIALIFVFPIFINGIIHFEKFDEHSRRNFYLLLISFLFIIANLICTFGILL